MLALMLAYISDLLGKHQIRVFQMIKLTDRVIIYEFFDLSFILSLKQPIYFLLFN